MKVFKRILLGLVIVTVLAAAYIQFAPSKTYDLGIDPFEVSKDSTVLAHGEYLVYGPARCSECHSKKDYVLKDSADRAPLSGRHKFELPFGSIYSANLTPDVETGIGSVDNGVLVRSIRHSINRNGKVMMPFMGLTHISDYDAQAIVSYLKSQPPVKNEIQPLQVNFLGKLALKFLLKPTLAEKEISEKVEEALSIEYGEYLVNEIANCDQCHTPFDMGSMSFVEDKLLSGGDANGETQMHLIAPNLTPDEKTGRITNWSEDVFVSRFRTGKVFQESIMPWANFKEMKEDDLRSIFRYLQSLDPIENPQFLVANE